MFEIYSVHCSFIVIVRSTTMKPEKLPRYGRHIIQTLNTLRSEEELTGHTDNEQRGSKEDTAQSNETSCYVYLYSMHLSSTFQDARSMDDPNEWVTFFIHWKMLTFNRNRDMCDSKRRKSIKLDLSFAFRKSEWDVIGTYQCSSCDKNFKISSIDGSCANRDDEKSLLCMQSIWYLDT